jgi:hypothetical protein
MDSYKRALMSARCIMRTADVWGDIRSLQADINDERLKIFETVRINHFHFARRHILWFRELWVETDLNHIFQFQDNYRHTFKIGSFSYILGRGIALGPYYLTNPIFRIIQGFSAIEQFAYGALITGELVKKRFFYDIYGAIYTSRTSNFEQTALNVHAQEFGRGHCPARGFGIISFSITGRLRFEMAAKDRKTHLELYGLFQKDPTSDSDIQFFEDQERRLATFGCAGDFVWKRWEGGFDTAFNAGAQFAKGIDRNIIESEVINSFIRNLNSDVFTVPEHDRAPVTIEHQRVIDRSVESQFENGKLISPDLRNGPNRFRNPYNTLLRGKMFVADAAYSLIPLKLKIAGTIAVASGGADPNVTLVNPQRSDKLRVNNNFIGLLEGYNGKRVVNAFFLNGPGIAIPRFIDIPAPNTAIPNATLVNSFTDLIFTGVALHYTRKFQGKVAKINPNILPYWSAHQTRDFSHKPPRRIPRYLGLEANVLVGVEPIVDCEVIGSLMLFFPGTAYKALKGQRVTFTNRFITEITGTAEDQVGVTRRLGDNIAWMINCGIKYKF